MIRVSRFQIFIDLFNNMFYTVSLPFPKILSPLDSPGLLYYY